MIKIKRIFASKMQELKEKINIYNAYFKMNFLNEIQYKIAAFAGVCTQFAYGGMYIMLYATFLKNATASDYTIEQMSTYIWLQQGFLMMFNMWSSLGKDIFEECETGTIAMELVRPINLYSIWHAKTLGKKLSMTILRLLPILIICAMPIFGEYKLAAPVSISAFILFLITLILSIILIMSAIMIMYVVVMKNISSKGIRSAFQITIGFLAGSDIPIAFMPDLMIKILKYTPFYYMQNSPFNIYNGYVTEPVEIIKIILLQVIWIIILTAIGKISMNNQLKKVVVQGG